MVTNEAKSRLAGPILLSLASPQLRLPHALRFSKGGNLEGMRREMFAPSASSTSCSLNFYADVNPIRDSQIPRPPAKNAGRMGHPRRGSVSLNKENQ
jgi:hypothetical protein